jgi:hypothetical protein
MEHIIFFNKDNYKMMQWQSLSDYNDVICFLFIVSIFIRFENQNIMYPIPDTAIMSTLSSTPWTDNV